MKRIFSLLVFCILLSPLWADLPFREHRFSLFQVLPVQSHHVVFVGNSITNMHPWCEAWGSPDVLNRGVSGASSEEILQHIDPIVQGHPREVYLMIGTNDRDVPVAQTIDHIRQILRRFADESPHTRLFLQTLLASDVGHRSLDLIEELNREMVAMAQSEFPQVTIVDTYHAVTGILNGTTSADRLHITAEGYRRWMEEIQRVGGMQGYEIRYPTHCPGLTYVVGGSNGMRNTYFANLPLCDEDILFLGDELVNGGEWAELLDNPHVKNRGYNWGHGGLTPRQYAQCLPLLTRQARPRAILLYTSPSDTAAYHALIDTLLLHTPRILLLSHLTSDNAFPQHLATTDPRITYCDILSGLPPLQDGYLTGQGYLHVARILRQHLLSLSTP